MMQELRRHIGDDEATQRAAGSSSHTPRAGEMMGLGGASGAQMPDLWEGARTTVVETGASW